MITLKTSESGNDLMSDGSGGIAIATGAEALRQTAREYMLAIRGEMIRKMDEGMPYDAVAWSAQASAAQFEAEARRRLMQVAGVVGVSSLIVFQEENILRYTATIETVYGEQEING